MLRMTFLPVQMGWWVDRWCGSESCDLTVSHTIWVFPKIVVITPKSSISIGFSIINHPFWGTTIFGNIYMRYQRYNLGHVILFWKLEAVEHIAYIARCWTGLEVGQATTRIHGSKGWISFGCEALSRFYERNHFRIKSFWNNCHLCRGPTWVGRSLSFWPKGSAHCTVVLGDVR